VLAAVVAHGRSVRGRRAVDLMIAATALAYDLPLYTCDPDDLRGLVEIITVVHLSG
jgi:predicted nucleic acid-binding protein